MSDFWQFFSGRLATVKQPLFRLRELETYPQESWQPLFDAKILVRAGDPESIVDARGVELTIRRSGESIFGIDESEEVPAIHPLEPADVVHYSVSVSALLKKLRQANSIKGNGRNKANGLYYLGNKSLPDTGDCRVYLAIGCGSSETMEARLHALADPTSAAVVVLPEDIGMGHNAKLSSLGVFVATLDTDFAIHWPQNIQLSPHMQNTVNRELVGKVDEGFKQMGVNMSELKGENDLLKSALADKMTHLANEVEPEYYTWMMHVLATGSVSGAAKLVGMANSTFTDKLKTYRARGGVYETLFQIHEVRRRTMGTKKVERYNDMYAAHQESESSSDSDLLRDVFEAFRDQNSANWDAIRSEMLEVLQDVVP